MNTSLRAFTLGVAAAAVLAGCGRSGTDETAAAGRVDSAAGTDTAGGVAGMHGTGGMSGMMGDVMADSMRAHMRMMDTTSAGRMRAMLPMHRQMVANMLSRMNQEMRRMNMPADAAWSATVDSLRQDLTGMPDMSGAELKALMPAHHARMTRLMQMHREMMGRTKS